MIIKINIIKNIKNMGHNIPLEMLDKYAQTLTKRQAQMLYEHKCNKKYKKPLYENMRYQSNKNNNIMLTADMLDEAKTDIGSVIDKYANKYALQYNIFKRGIHLYTPLLENYVYLLTDLIKDGFSKRSLMNAVVTKEDKKIIKNL